MGWIDVAIPGIAGLFLMLAPRMFFQETESVRTDAERAAKRRVAGCILLVVAALYLLIKLARPS